MARTKSNTFHFLPVAEGCKSSSLLRALGINPTQMETVQAIVKSHKGQPKMTRTEMTEICKKLFDMSYPPYWLFKNIAIRVAGTKLFDLSRLKVSAKPVKPPKWNKPKVGKEVTEKERRNPSPRKPRRLRSRLCRNHRGRGCPTCSGNRRNFGNGGNLGRLNKNTSPQQNGFGRSRFPSKSILYFQESLIISECLTFHIFRNIIRSWNKNALAYFVVLPFGIIRVNLDILRNVQIVQRIFLLWVEI